MATEDGFDALFVRNGADVNAPLINSGFTNPNGWQFMAGGWQSSTQGPRTNTVPVQANAGTSGCPAAVTYLEAAPNGGTALGGAFGANTSATGGSLFFQFDSDASVTQAGWASSVISVPKNIAASTMTAPANQVVPISTATACLGVMNTPAPTVNWAATGTTTAGFTSVAQLTYSVGSGAETAVGTYTINNAGAVVASTVPATVTVGGFAAGASTITWRLRATCNGTPYPAAVGNASVLAIACQLVQANATGVDITCPSSSIISLAAGECEQTYCYNVCAASCSGFGIPPTTLVSPNPGWTQQGQNTYYFNITNPGNVPIIIQTVSPRMWSSGNATNMRVYVSNGSTYVGQGGSAANWTQVHNSNITLPNTGIPGVGTALPLVPLAITTPITIPPGGTKGIAIFSSFFTGGGPITSNSAGATTWTDGNVVLNCGPGSLANNNPFGTLGAGSPFAGNWSYTGNVTYQAFSTTTCYEPGNPFFVKQPATTPEPCAKLSFKQSPYQFGFKVTDAAGNTATCSWSVTVNEFSPAITALICNNNVQLSLDEDCNVCMGADQVLEGGPYHCYDDYAVEVKKTTNGAWVAACLGNADINKTYEIRVRDLKTPFNTCWGKVSVEDKLAPKLVCANSTVPCNANIAPQYAPIAGTAVLEFGPAPINDNATTTVTKSYSAGGFPAIISDVNVAIDITHTWVGDIALRVKSPAGTTINLWNNNCLTGDNLFWVADDEGIASNLCVDYHTSGQNINLTILSPTTPLSLLDGQDATGTWEMTVADNAAGDNGTVNKLTVFIAASAVPATYAPQITDNCKTFTSPYMAPMVTFSDNIVDNGCNGAVLTRVWTARDQSNNSATCSQVVTLETAVLADVELPGDFDDVDNPAIDCGDIVGNYPYPDVVTSITGIVSSPNINGAAAGDYCHIAWNYVDVIIDVCDGTYKIKRTWSIIDWCTGTGFDYVQIIKVLDSNGPSIEVDADVNTPSVQAPNILQNVPTVILTTDYYTCCSKENAPALIVSDDCSDVVSAKVSTPIGNLNGVLTNLGTWPQTWQVTFPNTNLCFPLGTHIFTYTVKDDCGNTSTQTQRVIVRDWTPPVALCQEYTTVAIGTDDVNDCYPANGITTDANKGGIVWVPATAFNNGSYDNCSNIALTVRRMAPYSDCINQLNPQDGDPFCDPNDFQFDLVSEYALAISENDSIKFYCCEVGTSQMVILRVYQLDIDGNFVFGPDNQPIYNECMVEIEVQDKIKPFCQAPQNKTVNCDEFDPLVWYGNLTYGDNCCVSDLDTAITYVPNQITFEQCNYGQVRRTFTVKDCNNNSSRCTQTITVNYKENYRIYFPDDKNFTVCNTPGADDVPVIYGENCELIGVTHDDQLFDVVPDACYKILRTWKVINWCTYNPNLGSVIIPNSNTSTQGARVWIGEGGAGNLDWAAYNPNNPDVATIAAKTWAYPAPLTGTATNPEGTPEWVYTQVIKVQDATAPQANIDPTLGTANYTFCDYSSNDANQWNEDASYNPYGINNTWSPTCQSHDLCEGTVDLSIWATDACSDDNLNFRYLLFLDLNGDGVMETTINSEIPTWGFGIREDEKQTIAGVKYLKGQVTRDFETDDPDHTKYGSFALPYGSHKIKWTVEDRCGNDFTKEYPIVVKDCKNPTVVCINGLSINGMNAAVGTTPAGVTVWATDFLLYAEDNCTDASQIVFAIRDADLNPGSGFPLNAQGQPQSSLTWDCSQLGTNVVELWAKDKWGNADFCLTYLILTDNTGACNPNSVGTVAGDVKTNAQFSTGSALGVSEVGFDVAGNTPGLPNFNDIFKSNDNGHYEITGLPVGNDYTITPNKDVNPLNGVSTFDLVKMSKHILNVAPFTNAFEYVAADINKNNQVTTFDIVELRKLILGIYTDFPANESWRFVDKNLPLVSGTNPLNNNMGEVKQFGDLLAGMNDGNNFAGVKIGDVTGDAIANNLMVAGDRNPVATQLFDIKDRNVTAGEEFTVDFNAADLAKANGFQFTMNFNGLEFVELVPGANLTAENFAVFAADKAITTSWNGDAANATFSVKFRATADGKISNMIAASGRITAAEAYTKNNEQMDVAFRFNGENGSTIAGVGFELYQNQPNPFVEKTFIGFNLPEAAQATLTVYDAQGKALYSVVEKFNKGFNQVPVDRTALKGAGLVYYTLETAKESATRKMIMMD